MISPVRVQRERQRKQVVNQQRALQPRQVSIPPPYGGINTISSLADMPPTDAVSMENWFPDGNQLRIRSGFTVHQQLYDESPIQTIHPYDGGGGDATTDLLASTGARLFVANATYIQTGVVFDGAVRLENEIPLTYDTFTFSCWLEFDASTNAVDTTIFHSEAIAGGAGIKIKKTTGNKIEVVMQDATPIQQFDLLSTNTFTSASGYVHILCAVDRVAGVGYLYVSDAQEAAFTGATIAASSGSNFIIGATRPSGGNEYAGDMADFFWSNTFTDISVAANRRPFIDANGDPVDLETDGTGAVIAPIMWHRGSATQFLMNKASGQLAYTLTQEPDPEVITSSRRSGSQAAVPMVLSLTNGNFQSVNFGGNMFLSNGADTPQVFNGTTFTNWTGSGSGLTPANVIGNNIYKNRLYVWEDDSTSVWYGATNTIGGTFTEFPLGEVARHGGKLVSMGTWTVDGGEGVDDLAVFCMAGGEVIIYQGADPVVWSLVGIYRLGRPLSARALTRVGGDLLIVTEEDYSFLSEILKKGFSHSKISGAAREAAAQFGSNTGWDVINYPKGRLVLVNVPTSATTFEQYVLSQNTRAWTKFTGINAYSWSVHEGILYFGGANGTIYQADNGNTDNGTAITASAQQAWTNLGAPQNKLMTAVRPVMISDSAISVTMTSAADFAALDNSQTFTVDDDWHSFEDHGTHIGWKFSISMSDETIWHRTDVQATQGHHL